MKTTGKEFAIKVINEGKWVLSNTMHKKMQDLMVELKKNDEDVYGYLSIYDILHAQMVEFGINKHLMRAWQKEFMSTLSMLEYSSPDGFEDDVPKEIEIKSAPVHYIMYAVIDGDGNVGDNYQVLLEECGKGKCVIDGYTSSHAKAMEYMEATANRRFIYVSERKKYEY